MPKTKNLLSFKTVSFLCLLLVFLPMAVHAATGSWASTATGGNITYTTTDAPSPVLDVSNRYLTVVYLENLGLKKLGGNSTATDVAWLLSKGYRVIELNYANHVNAVTPAINQDIIKINDALLANSFCGYTNCSVYRSWVLFEGYRIERDISYFKDDPTVYNYPASYTTTTGDSIRMDLIYPANASVTVPVVLSFSYSNSYFGTANNNQRLNLGNTLAGFDDSFLEGAPANGIAWAIADHPKYCNWGNGKPTGGSNDAYKSYETNPDAARKVKSAVRTLRALGSEKNLSGKIGIYGFSRGSDAGSMAVGDRVVPEFENAGLYIDTSDDVQAAALGSGVFDFTQIYNATGDGDSNLETRCPWVWGALASNYAYWQTMGSAYLAQTSATAPVLFFYNTSDALYYQDQIAHFKAKLDSLGVPTSTVIDYGTGHAVPQTSASLSAVYVFFKQYLTPPSVIADTTTSIAITLKNSHDLPLALVYSVSTNELKLTFSLSDTGNVRFELYNMSGLRLYVEEKRFDSIGFQTETIHLEKPLFPQGLYTVKVVTAGSQGIMKFLK